ncbi:ABC transporter ATP-binding protein [Patescibacteria group bacterium]|nr:ABC transporter ATP-binding protein [Patescibacteria group bacterium]
MSDGTKPAAIKIVDLKKVYGTGVEALKGVSLTIAEGEFFALLGPNGAGKSTLISVLAGLAIKTSGTVEVCGVSIDENIDKAKSFIGIVPQEFNFNWFETVIDIIINQAGYYGIPRHVAMPRANELIENLGLADKRDTQAMKLSGGMKRRLMIARSLIHEPRVLLLDEPTAGVDVELRRGMHDFLRELNAAGTTIILTTHYLEEAEQLSREVAIINNGSIIKQGSVKSLLANMNSVTLLLDTVAPISTAELQLARALPITRIDDTTLQLKLAPGETVNDYIRKLSTIGVQISNIRNNGSRLEEVFIDLIQKD